MGSGTELDAADLRPRLLANRMTQPVRPESHRHSGAASSRSSLTVAPLVQPRQSAEAGGAQGQQKGAHTCRDAQKHVDMSRNYGPGRFDTPAPYGEQVADLYDAPTHVLEYLQTESRYSPNELYKSDAHRSPSGILHRLSPSLPHQRSSSKACTTAHRASWFHLPAGAFLRAVSTFWSVVGSKKGDLFERV